MVSNRILIGTLVRDGHLKSRRIIDAFEKIDRVHFVPEKFKSRAYVDEPLPIGFGQTISQPLTVAFMLELLDPQPGERVLEVGAGSGWKTALIAHIVGTKPVFDLKDSESGRGKKEQKLARLGHVLAIERILQLHGNAVTNVSKFGFIEKGIVTIVHGDGSKGYSSQAPFDKIIAGAAGSSVPHAWKEQVRVGGRIVIPIEDSIKVLDKKSPIDFTVTEYSGFRFVPLITDSGGG